MYDIFKSTLAQHTVDCNCAHENIYVVEAGKPRASENTNTRKILFGTARKQGINNQRQLHAPASDGSEENRHDTPLRMGRCIIFTSTRSVELPRRHELSVVSQDRSLSKIGAQYWAFDHLSTMLSTSW